MQNHYFISSNNPSAPFLVECPFLGENYTLYSASGVFSAKNADYGSLLLAKTALKFIEGKTMRLLDLGCGNGLVAVLLALSSTCHGDLVDINQDAVNLAKMNIEKYQLKKRLNAFYSDGYTDVKDKYDLILFNPPIRAGKKVYYPLFNKSQEYLNEDGILLVVIRKKLGAESALQELKKDYLTKVVAKERGYQVIMCQKQ